jgi:hypothetical protein
MKIEFGITPELEQAMESAGCEHMPIVDFLMTEVGKLWVETTRQTGGALPYEALTTVDALRAVNSSLQDVVEELRALRSAITVR